MLRFFADPFGLWLLFVCVLGIREDAGVGGVGRDFNKKELNPGFNKVWATFKAYTILDVK